jgi:hypothetical protein
VVDKPAEEEEHGLSGKSHPRATKARNPVCQNWTSREAVIPHPAIDRGARHSEGERSLTFVAAVLV